jgi:hypothetical protein
VDLGEAADYILAEQPGLDEDHVWAVLNELGDPPGPGAETLALDLLARARPQVSRRDARRIIGEWQAYARGSATGTTRRRRPERLSTTRGTGRTRGSATPYGAYDRGSGGGSGRSH